MYHQKIKIIRQELGLSVAKLSKKIGIPERTIVSYERNERMPSIEFLAQLCKTFDVNANWFIFDKGEMFNAPQFEQVEDALTLKVEEILRKNKLI